MFFREVAYFLCVVRFLYVALFIVFLIFLISVGPVVISPFIFDIVKFCLLFYLSSLGRDLPIILIFSKKWLKHFFLFSISLISAL